LFVPHDRLPRLEGHAFYRQLNKSLARARFDRYVERQNLNTRMQNRRCTRLTNAFSKKADMLAYSIAITFFYHNFIRVRQTIKTTPAVKAGLAKRKWKIEDMEQLSSVPMFAAG
jgi:hypothetical protein